MRAYASVIINCFWTMGQMVVGFLAFSLNNDWRLLILVGMSVPLALLMPLIIAWAYESPMYIILFI